MSSLGDFNYETYHFLFIKIHSKRMFGLFIYAFLSSNTASAQNLCVYDPGGKAGDYYRLLEGYALEASAWGVSFDIQVYTDEFKVVKDYGMLVSDAVLATGARLQRFNSFPTTVEAIGALPEYSHLKYMVKTLSTSKGVASKIGSRWK